MEIGANLPGFRNKVLAALPADEQALVLPHVKLARLVGGQSLIEADQSVSEVFFIEHGVASAQARASNENETIEVALIGNDCVAGAQAILGGDTTSFISITMLVAGEAYRMNADNLLRGLDETPVLRDLLTRRLAVFIASIAQTAACNSKHKVDHRLARWLLMARDLARKDEMTITQDAIASLIGVGRPSLTIAMLSLEKAGLIQHLRSRTTILDRNGLEAVACPCYHRLREYAIKTCPFGAS